MKKKQSNIDIIHQCIKNPRKELLAHPLFAKIETEAHLQTFATYHVFAVWDFMSLLKALQRALTCTQTPWVPVGNAGSRFFINEIVTGEESDIHPHGGYISHFELYLQAMQQMGANTTQIDAFVAAIRAGHTVAKALQLVHAPEAVQDFVRFTFKILEKGNLVEIASLFTFGREDLIPDMFLGIVQQLEHSLPEQLKMFRYYLERHIEVDGGHHGILALNMMHHICGDDEQAWQQAAEVAAEGLRMRIRLWDGVLAAIA